MKRRLSYDQLVQARVSKLRILMIVCCVALICRFAWIQIYKSSEYKDLAEKLIVRKFKLPAQRGTIYDRNGNKLAVSIKAYDIQIRPLAVGNKEETAKKLAELTKTSQQKLYEKVNTRRNPFLFLRNVDVDLGKRIEELGFSGVDVLPAVKRVYTQGSMAAHVLGFTNVDGEGMEGLERTFDKELRGEDGYFVADIDALGTIIPGTERDRKEPVHGKDIVLTIDSTIQHSLERELDKSFVKYEAKGASAIVYDPETGEILALANRPTFDPNKFSESSADSRRNRAVSDLYEPGSTLKTITACAALEEKTVTKNDKFKCAGSIKIGRRTVRCSLHRPFLDGHGLCDMSKMLKYSCNIAAAQVGMKMGREGLSKYEELFGFYERPGTGMPAESSASKTNPQNWSEVRVANVAFGQGIVVTPMQLTRAYGAVANGGVLMHPYVVKEMRTPDGITEKMWGPEAVRAVVSPETADEVAKMLRLVVTGGTGKNADIDGYKVCGKTGSAQKALPGGGGYAPDKFIPSFAGFVPYSDPKAVILVVVDEPKGSHFGATVAAPVFREVARSMMWYLKVPPDDIDKEDKNESEETGKANSADSLVGSASGIKNARAGV